MKKTMIAFILMASAAPAMAIEPSTTLKHALMDLNNKGNIVTEHGCDSVQRVKKELRGAIEETEALESAGNFNQSKAVAFGALQVVNQCTKMSYQDARFILKRGAPAVGRSGEYGVDYSSPLVTQN